MKLLPKLTEPQKRMLATVPNDWEPIKTHFGFRSVLGNQTLRALRAKGIVEVLMVPPRWRISPLYALATIHHVKHPRKHERDEKDRIG
jgi:hypothetical protein